MSVHAEHVVGDTEQPRPAGNIKPRLVVVAVDVASAASGLVHKWDRIHAINNVVHDSSDAATEALSRGAGGDISLTIVRGQPHYLTPTLLIVTVKPTEAGLGITLKETDPGHHGSQVGPNPGYVREDVPTIPMHGFYYNPADERICVCGVRENPCIESEIKTCAPNLATTAGKFIFFILYVAVPITIFIAIVMRVS